MPSSIEWTDETWNPVTGCTRVSPGCDHCYMYALYPRLKGMGVRGYETGPDEVLLLPERLQAPLSWKKPRRVFVNSMSDVFHPRVPYDFVLEMFRVMETAATRNGHIFQILTKRPGRATDWWLQHEAYFPRGWPSGVWIGTSVESQKYAPRLTVLGRLPAAVRFVSAEPLLDKLDLTYWLRRDVLQWVIVGGESGPGARKMDPSWARSLRDQTIGNGVAFFLKQLGGVRDKRSGEKALLDGKLWQQYPNSAKGKCNAAHEDKMES
ncbi:MAG: phage Gp37/Gp68 family protein [Caldilineaceae bacterium SB0664_bin_27]|uniref:Phage Gp37/Gp68 family protein n=1 Tax=Caldilineaceae bacterium SB0664_bin_27 TaxID=2605260 RepID=A0A6B0YU61_9CHLR|nr:phage Gp37/Gp68 family protein [Caldilineaceae bacterium SB0664_bin_27]